MSKYEINKLKDWSGEAQHTHAPPPGERLRPHLHGEENSPAYIIHPLQLISDPAAARRLRLMVTEAFVCNESQSAAVEDTQFPHKPAEL